MRRALPVRRSPHSVAPYPLRSLFLKPIIFMLTLLSSSSRVVIVAAAIGSLAACSLLSPSFDDAPAPIGLGLIYPAGSIATVERADKALSDAKLTRQNIEQQYRSEQIACFKKFFVSDCTDAAKERHRVAVAETRAVEVEADFIKRQDRAAQRDASIAERAAQEAAKAPQRAQDAAAREKTAAEKSEKRGSDAVKAAQAEQKASGIDPQGRQRAFDSKFALREKKAAQDNARRSDNAAAFEKKQADALARQKQIAEKKAKKAEEQNEKDAAAKKSGDVMPDSAVAPK